MPQSRTARRALAAQRQRDELEGTGPQPAARRTRPAEAAIAWPSKITVAELDELATKHGVELAEGATKGEKQAALEAAGIGPEG